MSVLESLGVNVYHVKVSNSLDQGLIVGLSVNHLESSLLL